MTIAAGYGNISDFEIMFLIIAVFGFAFSLLNLRGISKDARYLKGLGRTQNGLWLLTKAAWFNEAGRSFLQLVFIYIAILSMRMPDPPSQVLQLDRVLSAVARWAFLIAAAWVMAKTCYTWYVRLRLQEIGVFEEDDNA